MNRSDIKNFLLVIDAAINDELLSNQPEIRDRTIRNIYREAVPGSDYLPLPESFGFHSALQLYLAKLLIAAYQSEPLESESRGLVLFFLYCFDPLLAGKSLAAIFRECQNSNHIATILSALFSQYSGAVLGSGIPSESMGDLKRWRTASDYDSSQLRQWVSEKISTVVQRTAQRDFDEICEKLRRSLQKIAPAMFGDIAEKSQSEPLSQKPVHASTIDVRKLIQAESLQSCFYAPASFGFEFPILESVAKRLNIDGEDICIDFLDYINWLRGCCGLISGAQGSGKTTLIRAIAYHCATSDSDQVVCYLDAHTCLPDAEKYLDVLVTIARGILGERFTDRETRKRVIGELRKMGADGELIVLVDNLEKLTSAQRKRIVLASAGCNSIYFSITSSMAEGVRELMASSGYTLPLRTIELVPLSSDEAEQMETWISIVLNIARVNGTSDLYVSDLQGSPLYIMAKFLYLNRGGRGGPLALPLRLLSEMVQRNGFEAVKLVSKFEELNGTSQLLCRLGGAIYETIIRAERDYDPSPDRDDERPLFWISVPVIESYLNDLRRGSLDDLLKMGFFNYDPENRRIQLIDRQFEILLAAIFRHYNPDRFRRTMLDNILVGWIGHLVHQVEQVKAEVSNLITQ